MRLNKLIQRDYTSFSLYYQIKLPLDLEIVFKAVLEKSALASQPTVSRFFNRMDEDTLKQFQEINRILTDRISALMCCCSALGRSNLAAEGLTLGTCNTSDIMYDLFLRMKFCLRPKKSVRKWPCAQIDLSLPPCTATIT